MLEEFGPKSNYLMTALDKYQRIEALGLWRADNVSQRKDVLISIGETTLLISDMQEQPLAHWSLAAIERANPGNFPAIYHPDGDHEESLELNYSEKEMKLLEAIIESIRGPNTSATKGSLFASLKQPIEIHQFSEDEKPKAIIIFL